MTQADLTPPVAAAPRCSQLSAARGEPMLGTAFTEPGLLLVEQPGPWGHGGLAESRFDRAVAAALGRRAAEAGLRVLAIRRPGRSEGGRRRWAVLPAGARDGLRWGGFDEDRDLLDVALDGTAGELDPAPAYLVCTHGRRDVCCAVRGRPVAARLEALRPGRVWECSHTGGHRFAPIVLALPVGALYGRVPEDVLPELVAAAERGEVLPALLRGLIGHAPAEQAALGHLLAGAGLRRPDQVRVLAAAETEPGRWRVQLGAAAGAQWTAELALESVPTPYPSCAKPAAKDEDQVRLLDLRPA